ncbi:MAG: HEAT repeat domain-containing protein [Planctomycetes bacterium]|nr:HEAT repeat domain-containing protein [Planctomycetota bacterium]
MNRSRRTTAALLAALAAACARGPADTARSLPLPPIALRPLQGELTALGKTMPQVPAEAANELRDLADIALHIVEADSRTSTHAERALLEHPFAWSVLEPALDHADVAVRKRAAWLAGRTGQSILVVPLLLRLKYELDSDAILWAADALQRLGNDAGLSWLEAAMGVAATAQQAGTMAIEICRERGVPLGESPTYDELRAHLRTLLAAWLQTGLGSRPGTAPPDPVQLDARLAIHLSTTQGTQLRPVDDARFVLTRAGMLGVPLMTRALGAEENYLRTMALQVLADLRSPAHSASGAVLALLGDPFTASYAVRTLGEIGAAEAIPHLRARLASPDTEIRAAVPPALGLLGDRASAEALRKSLRDSNEVLDVRVNAAFGLLCLGPDHDAEAFLAEREQKADYHAPTLVRLRERLALLRH